MDEETEAERWRDLPQATLRVSGRTRYTNQRLCICQHWSSSKSHCFQSNKDDIVKYKGTDEPASIPVPLLDFVSSKSLVKTLPEKTRDGFMSQCSELGWVFDTLTFGPISRYSLQWYRAYVLTYTTNETVLRDLVTPLTLSSLPEIIQALSTLWWKRWVSFIVCLHVPRVRDNHIITSSQPVSCRIDGALSWAFYKNTYLSVSICKLQFRQFMWTFIGSCKSES